MLARHDVGNRVVREVGLLQKAGPIACDGAS